VHRKLFPAIRFDFLLYYYTIIRGSLTLKTFSAVPTHAMNVCANFHTNPSATYGDLASGVNGRTDVRTDNPETLRSPPTTVDGGIKQNFNKNK